MICADYRINMRSRRLFAPAVEWGGKGKIGNLPIRTFPSPMGLPYGKESSGEDQLFNFNGFPLF
jgi:hypothetical protein